MPPTPDSFRVTSNQEFPLDTRLDLPGIGIYTLGRIARAEGFGYETKLEYEFVWTEPKDPGPSKVPDRRRIINHVDVKFMALHDQAILPSKAYHDDAGFDLFACMDITIPPGTPTDVPTGIACELPEGTWGMIVGRSSTFRKRHLMVNMSVIDVGWRGDLFVNAVNLTQQPVEVKKGERIGQIIFLPNPGEAFNPVMADSLRPHPRGEKGFGSTGA